MVRVLTSSAGCSGRSIRAGPRPAVGVGVVAVFLAFGVAAAHALSASIGENEAVAVAGLFADNVYGPGHPTGCWLYCDTGNEPAVYVCERELGDGRLVTVMVGASTLMPPVLLHYQGPAPDRLCADEAKAVASRLLGGCNPEIVGRVYYSPLDLWFSCAVEDDTILVSVRGLRPAIPAEILRVQPMLPSIGQLMLNTELWQCFRSGSAMLEQDGQCWIEAIPDWDWHYGCAPTAAANILTYWDRHGFDRLVDTVFRGVYDPIEGDIDSVPDVSRKLAVAMETDTLGNGSTAGERIPLGIAEVCNDPRWGAEYGFVSWLSWDNTDLLVAEIDSGRPGVLCLLGHPQYGNHTVTFCGWGPPSRDWVMVHDCWGSTPLDVVINLGYGGPVGVVAVRPPEIAVAPADVALTEIVRPIADALPGVVVPAFRAANRGGQPGAVRAFFRIERPGGGIDEGFDGATGLLPVGWQIVGSGAKNWVFVSDSGGVDGRAECRSEGSGADSESWLLTPLVRLGPGDTICFQAAACGQAVESVEVWAGYWDPESGQNAVLVGGGSVGDEQQELRVGFAAVGDTLLRVGFRRVGGDASGGLRLDDVRLAAVHYSDSVAATIEPGAEVAIAFRPWTVMPGHYVARCSLWCENEEPHGDTAVQAFVVRYRASEPKPNQEASVLSRVRMYPSVVRGPARLEGWRGWATMSIYDVAGRVVLKRRIEGPATVDLSNLGSGLYVLRLQDSEGVVGCQRFSVCR